MQKIILTCGIISVAAVLQNIASTACPDGVTSILGLQGALPILFGDNIGTTITALLASIGASLDAKRTALSHVIFNVTGTFIFIWFIPKIALFISAISPSGHEADVISRQIANAHLIFNLTNTLIFLPFVGLLAVFVTKLIPGHNRSILPGEPLYIDKRTVDRPAFAINLAVKELGRLGSYTEEMLELSRKAFIECKKECAKKVFEIENYVNELEDHIVSYLSTRLTSGRVVERDVDEVSYLLHVAADIEHIGDHCINITELAVSKHENKYEFSGIAYEEISDMYDQTEAILKNALLSLEDNDKKTAAGVFEKEKLLNETEKKLRRHHLKRLNEKPAHRSLHLYI